jgi:hypothetical protein
LFSLLQGGSIAGTQGFSAVAVFKPYRIFLLPHVSWMAGDPVV